MEAPHEPYSGFANYQTWCVHWWLESDQEIARRCRELATQATTIVQEASRIVDGIGATAEAKRNFLADRLSEFVDEFNPVANETTLFSDLMGTALGEVDWHEIADAFLKP